MKTKLLLCIVFLCCSYGVFAQGTETTQKNTGGSSEKKSPNDLKSKSCTEKQDTIIEFDFEKGRYITSNVKPTRGRNVVFKIKNINPFFYKITTTPHDIEFDTNTLPEPPKTNTTEEKNIQLPTSDSVEKIEKSEVTESSQKKDEEMNEVNKKSIGKLKQDQATLKKDTENINGKIDKINNSLSQVDSKINEIKEKIRKKNDSISLINKTTTLSESELKVKNNLISLLGEENRKIEELEKKKIVNNEEKKKLENNLSSKESELISLDNDLKILNEEKSEKDQLVVIINTYLDRLNKNYGDFFISSNYVLRLNENYQNFVDKIMDPTLTVGEFENMIKGKGLEKITLIDEDNFQQFYGRINNYEDLKDKVTKSIEENALLQSINQLKSLPSGKKIAESIENGIKDKLKAFNTITQKISQLEIRKKLNYVETVVRKLNNDSTYEVTSQPIQPWGDYLEFDVQISERKSLGENYFLPNKSKSFKYSEFVRGGVRFDFSLGTVFDFGLKENTYEVMDATSGITPGYEIKQLSDNKYTPIIAAMLHSSIRSSTLCSLAFTLGVSVDPAKLQVESLFPGLSLMVGKKDKIVFTAGPSFRRINELNDIKYKLDQFTTVKPTDYMIESFKIGFFAAVSWSLTSKQKNIIKIPDQ